MGGFDSAVLLEGIQLGLCQEPRLPIQRSSRLPAGARSPTLMSLNARNALNHPNYAAPNGALSSPFFGQYLSLAGFGPFGSPSTYNRKIDVQLRFAF